MPQPAARIHQNERKETEVTQSHPLHWPAGWPRTPREKQDQGYQFKSGTNPGGWGRGLVTFAVARDKLFDELRKLDAKNVVVSTNHPTDRYGVPTESKRSTGDEGVAVYFQLNGKSMSMACDRYTGAAANMRSLGLAIEAMRQLARHGGGHMMERAFSGFAALPPPASERKRHWSEVLQVPPDAPLGDCEIMFKRLAMKAHPDNGGNAAEMAGLNTAIADARAAKGGR